MSFSGSIKVGHKIKIKRLKALEGVFGTKVCKPIKLTHRIKFKPLKPLKALRRMFGSWI
jgi:hypothetical protein